MSERKVVGDKLDKAMKKARQNMDKVLIQLMKDIVDVTYDSIMPILDEKQPDKESE